LLNFLKILLFNLENILLLGFGKGLMPLSLEMVKESIFILEEPITNLTKMGVLPDIDIILLLAFPTLDKSVVPKPSELLLNLILDFASLY